MEDWKQRMVDEYTQLRGRYERLSAMIAKYESGTLPFTPNCPLCLLKMQADIMRKYLDILEVRGKIEKINLFNVTLYNIRQYYFQEKKFLRYEENYHVCKTNENYGLLQAGVSQQTLKVADRSFKSFFNLIKKAKSGEYRFQDIKMPHYREKGGLSTPT